MVTLHEPDFPSLKVTVLQTADGGNTLILNKFSYRNHEINTIWKTNTLTNQ
jgi:hypothetical protein